MILIGIYLKLIYKRHKNKNVRIKKFRLFDSKSKFFLCKKILFDANNYFLLLTMYYNFYDSSLVIFNLLINKSMCVNKF